MANDIKAKLWKRFKADLEHWVEPSIRKMSDEDRFFGNGPQSFVDAMIKDLDITRVPCQLVLLGRDLDRLHVFEFEQVIRAEFPSPCCLVWRDINLLTIFRPNSNGPFEITIMFKGVDGLLSLIVSSLSYQEIQFQRPLTREEFVNLSNRLYSTLRDRLALQIPELFKV